MNCTDSELLDAFVENGSQGAFSELLGRYVNLVYSAALRQVGCQVQAAEDVTQKVFAHLAEKAPQLRGRATLSGWLYTSTRLAATEYRRAEARRIARESTAHSMAQTLSATDADPDWNQVRPWLDEAMADLASEDQEAVLLRYFEGRPYTEVGAHLGLAENTARMRVDRALTKLHTALSKRGVTSTATALGVALESYAVGPAPVGLVGRVSVAGAGVGGSTWALWLLRYKLTLASVALVLVTGLLLVVTRRTDREDSVGSLAQSATLDTNLPTGSLSSVANPETAAAASDPDAEPDPTDLGPADRILRLEFVERATGLPVANVAVVYLAWKQLGENPKQLNLTANRQGKLRVPIPPVLANLQLLSRVDEWADTRIHWRPEHGDEIPTNYVVRLDPGVALSGKVVDPEGKPLAGGKVEFRLIPNPLDQLRTESHDLGSARAEVDDSGHWRHSRIAADVLGRVRIRATSDLHLSSEELNPAESPEGIELLKSGQHVAQVRPALKIQGFVEDEAGAPISGATVKTQKSIHSDTRIAQSHEDGRFELQGCESSKVWLTASSPGFAPSAVRVRTVSPTQQPIRLVLGPARQLRFQVMDSNGRALSNAWFAYSSEDIRTDSELASMSVKPKVELFGRTDGEGRAEWNEAPAGMNRFIFEASGYKRTEVDLAADGREHPVTLVRSTTAAVVHGNITDSKSGRPISNGTVQLGYPAWAEGLLRGESGEPPPQFMSGGDGAKFSDGAYRYRIASPPSENSGHMLKFEAAGYQSFETLLVDGLGDDVRLDIALDPASEFEISVLYPDGLPASEVQIGLVRKGHPIWIGDGQIRADSFPTPELRTSDSKGRVTLSSDSRIDQVVAVHPAGFASVSGAQLQKDRILRLEPWGRIDVQFRGSNSTIKKVWIHPSESSSLPVKLNFDVAIKPVNEHGQVSFRRVPPGPWDVVSVHSVVQLDGPTSSVPAGDRVTVIVSAGASVNVQLGGGTRVTGQLGVPADFVYRADSRWHAQAVSIHHPRPPTELRFNMAAIKKWRQQPEIQAQLQREKILEVGIEKNGSFTLEGVPPGAYDLSAFLSYSVPDEIQLNDGIQRRRGKTQLRAKLRFTVPLNSEGGVIDLGALKVETEPSSKAF